MNSESSTHSQQIHHASELFHTRLTARLCVALACLVQLFSRILTVTINTAASGEPGKLLVISISFTPLMTLTVAIEYLLFKKYGPGILKFSNIVDLILLSLFIGDWTMGTISFILKAQQSDPALFSISVVYSFIGFIWRALLVTLIVQKWQLKIIAPVVVSIVTTVFAIHYDTEHFYFYLMRCAAQLFNPLSSQKNFCLLLTEFCLLLVIYASVKFIADNLIYQYSKTIYFYFQRIISLFS